MEEALKIINGAEGFMVSFERIEGGMLRSDYFPDRRAGEKLIETEDEAWELARKFAEKTKGKMCNIYVVDEHYSPVQGYKDKEIFNR